MRRFGADRPLAARQRELVWRVHQAYAAACREHGRLDWDDVVRLAHDRLRERRESAPRYDFVFVDEAQDLTVMALRVAALLARPPGELFVGFDAAQSIYERGFRFKDAGLTVHGARSFALTRNYRNTRAILDAALPLLSEVRGDHAADAGEAADLLQPDAAVREGAGPRQLTCRPGDEARAIAGEIERLMRQEGVRPEGIAVLAYPNRVKRAICRDLRTRGVICQEHDRDSEIRLADPSVKVLPVKSAKGLEFPVVFVVAAGRHLEPRRGGLDPQQAAAFGAEMRRLFYVAMTRAMAELILVYPDSDPPPFVRAGADVDEDTPLWQLYAAGTLGWGRFLRLYGLPADAGITRHMTLGEARALARRRRPDA